jgi:hypothetical protein
MRNSISIIEDLPLPVRPATPTARIAEQTRRHKLAIHQTRSAKPQSSQSNTSLAIQLQSTAAVGTFLAGLHVGGHTSHRRLQR